MRWMRRPPSTVEPLLGFELVAFIQPPGDPELAAPISSSEPGACRCCAPRPGRGLLPARLGRPHVVVALELDETARRGGLVERLIACAYGDVDIVSPMRGLPLAGTHVTHFFSHDVLSLRLYNNLARPWPRRQTRLRPAGGSLLLLCVRTAVPADQRPGARVPARPVFYRHERIGRRGKTFVCFKFRTMVPDADSPRELLGPRPRGGAGVGAGHKLKDDPRVTPIGRWLRQTSLDELPQLFNVLRGDMSLVGPRPVIAEELARYGDNLRLLRRDARPA